MAQHSPAAGGNDAVEWQKEMKVDQRELQDDALLDSLLAVCSHYGKAATRVSLTAGLPLNNNQLTLDVFPRAAARAGLRVRMLKRELKDITALSLPAVLVLENHRTAVLFGWNEQGQARVQTGEVGGGKYWSTQPRWRKSTPVRRCLFSPSIKANAPNPRCCRARGPGFVTR